MPRRQVLAHNMQQDKGKNKPDDCKQGYKSQAFFDQCSATKTRDHERHNNPVRVNCPQLSQTLGRLVILLRLGIHVYRENIGIQRIQNFFRCVAYYRRFQTLSRCSSDHDY